MADGAPTTSSPVDQQNPASPPVSGSVDVPPASQSQAPAPAPTVFGITPEPSPPTPAPFAPIPETVVVAPAPAGAPSPQGVIENPFIPKGVAPETPPSAAVAPPSGGGGGMRKILLLFLLLFIVGGLIIAGKFALGVVSGQKEVTITYWGLWEDDATTRSVIAAFTAQNPKIRVTYLKQSPKQYRERLVSAFARGEGPDVFRFHNTWVPMLRTELATVPVKIMTAQQFASTFYPVASRDLVAGQNIFGIPLMIDGLGLYYNEDILTSAGVTPPTTYEELLNIVPRLTVKNQNTIVSSAIALGTTGNIENFSDILATMFLQNGAKLTNPTGKEAEDALIFYRKFADPADPVYTWNDTLDNSIYAFASSKVAMIMAPSWRVFDIKQINPNLHFKVVPIPQLPGSTVTWASYWVEGVSSKSKNQEAAWQFVNYLTSRATAQALYTEESKTRLFGEPYARVDLGTSISADPYVGAYIKQAGMDARSFPLASRTFDNGINDKLIQYLTDAVNGMAGGAAPSGVLTTMASGFAQVLGTYGLSSGSPASQ